MKSRMERYYSNEENNTNLRSNKNKELYKKVHDSEINQFDINSNVSVLGKNTKNIDVENLKQILDKKYNETPKRKSIPVNDIIFNNDVEVKDEEKDYDINIILEKARKKKEINYEEERLKKVRNTQFDILNGLDINSKNDDNSDDEIESEEKELMTLINTIAINEKESQDSDLLDDLKGDNDDTKVLPVNDIKTMELKSNDDVKKLNEEKNNNNEETNKEKKDDSKSKEEKIKELENSFFTNSIKLSKKDFEDFEDLKGIDKSHPIRNFLIVIFIILFILIILIIINKVFDLGYLEKILKLIKK